MDIWAVLQWDLQILVQVQGVQVLKVHLTLQHLQAQVVASLDQIQRNLTPLMLVDGWMLVLVAGITIAVATTGVSQNHGLTPGDGSKNHPPRYTIIIWEGCMDLRNILHMDIGVITTTTHS